MSEPCHICGYHPGMGICSRMHDNPEAMTPLQANLAEALRLMGALMNWDNNALDDPSACAEYKADINACLLFITKHNQPRGNAAEG